MGNFDRRTKTGAVGNRLEKRGRKEGEADWLEALWRGSGLFFEWM